MTNSTDPKKSDENVEEIAVTEEKTPSTNEPVEHPTNGIDQTRPDPSEPPDPQSALAEQKSSEQKSSDKALIELTPQESNSKETSAIEKEAKMSHPDKQNEVVTIKKTGTALSIIAILLSTVAIGGSAFLIYAGQKEVAKIDRNTYSINSKTASTDLSLDEKFKETNGQVTRVETQSKEAQGALADKLAQLENELKQADSRTNEKLIQLYQELTKTQLLRTLNNTEITLNMAQTQLQLTNNIPAVVATLEQTNAQISELNLTQLAPLQNALKQDIDALNQTPTVDIAQISSELEALGNQAFKLPTLAQTVANAPTDEQIKAQSTPIANNTTSSWWTRTWNSIKSALGSLVEVRQKSPKDKPDLFSPEQSYFVRENMRLQFNDARLALLQKNEKTYLADLNAIEVSVQNYLDPKSAEVQKLLARLTELKKINFPAPFQLTTSMTALNTIQKTVAANTPAFTLTEVTTASEPEKASEPETKESNKSSAPAIASEPPPTVHPATKTGGQTL